MLGGLLRLVLVVIIVVAVGAFFFGYRWAAPSPARVVDRPIGTSGRPPIDTAKARQTGAAIGEKVAVGADRAEHAVAEASLTTKIKAKMALDDTIKARDIDVDTNGTVVTLSGRVSTAFERTRAVQLARETDGVTQVIDRLSVAAASAARTR
jgi:hyperosmotically inducible protein